MFAKLAATLATGIQLREVSPTRTEMGGIRPRPGQQNWHYAVVKNKDQRFLRLGDGDRVFNFQIPSEIGSAVPEYALQRMSDLRDADIETGGEVVTKGLFQVHKSDPSLLRGTLQDGKKNFSLEIAEEDGNWVLRPRMPKPRGAAAALQFANALSKVGILKCPGCGKVPRKMKLQGDAISCYDCKKTSDMDLWDKAAAEVNPRKVSLKDLLDFKKYPKTAGDEELGVANEEESKWEPFYQSLGKEKVDNFLEAFGLGPKYVPKEPTKYNCPECGQKERTWREAHADTGYDEMELCCRNCGYSSDKEEGGGEEKAAAMSADDLLSNGQCCGNGCQNCPYEPRHEGGTTKTAGCTIGYRKFKCASCGETGEIQMLVPDPDRVMTIGACWCSEKTATDYGAKLKRLRLRRGECEHCGKSDQPPYDPCNCKTAKAKRFSPPENYDTVEKFFRHSSDKTPEWRIEAGANDWETGYTAMSVTINNYGSPKRIWVKIDNSSIGDPGDYAGKKDNEFKDWGKKAVATWMRVARKLKDQKEPYRGWADAFRDALKEDEVKKFVEESGEENQVWTPAEKLAFLHKQGKTLTSTLREYFNGLIAERGKDVHTEPSEAQREAGNYRKGHFWLQGLDVTIENPAGSTRSGKNKAGKEWSVTMKHSYGYVRSFYLEGKRHFVRSKSDEDHIDVFVGDHPDSQSVFVVDQSIDGKFDEHKVMVGFTNEKDAKQAYLDNYSAGWKGFDAITPLTMAQFKRWMLKGDTGKPLAGAQVKEFMKTASDYPRFDALTYPLHGDNKPLAIGLGALGGAAIGAGVGGLRKFKRWVTGEPDDDIDVGRHAMAGGLAGLGVSGLWQLMGKNPHTVMRSPEYIDQVIQQSRIVPDVPANPDIAKTASLDIQMVENMITTDPGISYYERERLKNELMAATGYGCPLSPPQLAAAGFGALAGWLLARVAGTGGIGQMFGALAGGAIGAGIAAPPSSEQIYGGGFYRA